MPTFDPCSCCTGETPAHAILKLQDGDSGSEVQLRVPHAHRMSSIGWGSRERVSWVVQGQRRRGLLGGAGRQGVIAIDEDGNTHRLTHGTYQRVARKKAPKKAPEKADPLEKARSLVVMLLLKAKGLKAGERWITVHPNGEGEKGVPVLIKDNGDGTHSIIGGAGGKLNHLKLTGVKSEEEYKEQGKEKAKEKRAEKKAKDAERKATQSEEEAAAEKQVKADVKAAAKESERDFINYVRDKFGGVDADKDEDKLSGLSSAAKNTILARHHAKQLRQAEQRSKEVAEQLVDHGVERAQAQHALGAFMQAEPGVDEAAREMAALEIELAEQERQEIANDRRRKRQRNAGSDKAERSVEEAAAQIRETYDQEADQARMVPPGAESHMPSDDVVAKAIRARAKAAELLDFSEGEVELAQVDREALIDRAKLDADVDDETLKAAARKEAARQWRRAEVQEYRADKIRAMESEDPAKAAAAVAFSELMSGVHDEIKTAKKLGLLDNEKTPLQEAEVAEMKELLQKRAELRGVKKELRQMVQEVEEGAYTKAREAFDLNVTVAPEDIQAKIDQDVRTALARKLLGMANKSDADYLKAAAGGHYDALADVSQGIAGQRYLDRVVVDALGPKNAAILTRWAIEQDGHAPEAVRQALEDHHLEAQVRISQDAIQRADDFVPGFSKTIEDVGDIEQALNQIDAQRLDALEAQKAVGAALGRLESSAMLAQAFREGVPAALSVKAEDLQGGLGWMHAIGLTPDDYSVDYDEKEITLDRSAWNKLVQRIPIEEVARRKELVAIKSGQRDEPGWLPEGVVSREQSTFTADVPDAPSYAQPLDWSHSDIRESVREHVASRIAEGERPEDIQADVQSRAMLLKAGDRGDAYTAAVHELFPVETDENGLFKKVDNTAELNGLAQGWLDNNHPGGGTFHNQDIAPHEEGTREAVFRALAENPTARLAFIPPGNMTPEQRHQLRNHFYERMGIDAKKRVDEGAFHTEYGAHMDAKPERTHGQSLFGGMEELPEYTAWKREHGAILERHGRASLQEAIDALGPEPTPGTPEAEEYHGQVEALREKASKGKTRWSEYVEAHGNDLNTAITALQDELKGDFAGKFREHYGKITGRGLRMGSQEVTNKERHVKAVASPEQLAELRQQQREAQSRIQKRDGGKFAEMGGRGSVARRFTKHLEAETAGARAQMGFFGAPATKPPEAEDLPQVPDLGLGDRHSLGQRAEAQVASLVNAGLGENMKPGQPIDLFPGLNMDGPRIHQQRVIRMMDEGDGRLGGFLGTGSGKSLTSIGAFTHLHGKGKASHGLYLVPTAVAEQFGGEVSRFTEPGKYKLAVSTGMNHDQRVAMLKGDAHFRVMTHQSFRDTALKLMADHHTGGDVNAMKAKLMETDHAGGAAFWKATREANDIPAHFVYNDEAQNTTQRAGAQRSALNAVIDAVTHPENATQYLAGTATPHKNDESEIVSMAATLDPQTYSDRKRLRENLGDNIANTPSSIRRELDHRVYVAKIPPSGVDRTDIENPEVSSGQASIFGPSEPAGAKKARGALKLDPDHQALVDAVEDHYQRARSAHQDGRVDVEALRALSPSSFEGRPESEHEEIGRKLGRALGTVRFAAQRRAVNSAPAHLNTKLRHMMDVVEHDINKGSWTDRSGADQKGKPSIVFSDSLEDVRMIHEEAARRGLRVAMYHGGMSTDAREDVRRGFQPEGGGEPKYDLIIGTRAMEAGLNFQRGKVVHHYDVPLTEKAQNQRNGRAYRQGQQGEVETHDWHTDTEFDRSARRRLRRKEGLASVFQTPIASMDERGIASHYQRVIAEHQQAAEPLAAK